jgi:hypothetical protein
MKKRNTVLWISKIIDSCLNHTHCDAVIVLINQYQILYPSSSLNIRLLLQLEMKVNQINKS